MTMKVKAPAPGIIDGWLALLWFGLVIGGPLTMLVSLSKSNLPVWLNVLFGVLLIFSVFAGVSLHSTMKPAKIFLIVVCAIGALEVSLGIFLASFSGADAVDSRVFGGGFRAFLYGLVWLLYLHKSVRVKQTYPHEFAPAAKEQVA